MLELRTTDGWLPIHDIGPEGLGTAFQRLVVAGPLAGNARDLDLLLEAFEGDFPGQRMASAPSVIAYSRSLLGLAPDPATSRAFDGLLARLAGHSLVEAEPALDYEALFADWGYIAGFEYAGVLPAPLRSAVAKRLYAWSFLDRRLGRGPVTAYFTAGLLGERAAYERALARRTETLATVDRFFAQHRVWVLPVSPSSAILRSACGNPIATPAGPVDYSRYLGSYLVPTAMMGTPALAVPIGRDLAGMPIAAQFHGARYCDRALVASVDALFASP